MTADSTDLPSGPKLNLGCGPVQPVGWVNVDGSNRARLASTFAPIDRFLVRVGVLPSTEFGPGVKVLNLHKRLPFKENSVSCIYAGELWEHFEYPGAARLTGECFRVLAPGGVLRICVPDGVEFWKSYLDLFHETMDMPRPSRRAEPLREHVQMYFNDICTRTKWFGSMGHTHKWQFDEVQLVALLESKGFSKVERMRFHKSRIPDVDRVERSDFLIVEGVKSGL